MNAIFYWFKYIINDVQMFLLNIWLKVKCEESQSINEDITSKTLGNCHEKFFKHFIRCYRKIIFKRLMNEYDYC